MALEESVAGRALLIGDFWQARPSQRWWIGSPGGLRLNLLLFLPGRVLFYTEAQVLETRLVYNFGSMERRLAALEELEARMAREGQPGAADLMSIHTEDFGDSPFWQRVYDSGIFHGEILVHFYTEQSIPIEFFHTAGQEWVCHFAIRLVQSIESARQTPGQHLNAKSRQTLVWLNPLGPDLSVARQEAMQLAELLGARSDVRLVSRALSEFEYQEALHDADLFIYLGHARFRHGQVLIPLGADWLPMLWHGLSPGLSLVILAACLDTDMRLLQSTGPAFVHPLCRIADRPTVFLEQFLSSLTRGLDQSSAWLAACRADAQSGDIRRRLMRLQGKAVLI
ncbi:MAG: hypothetical protein KDK39_19415 [Leptospiraceae bacterium]|nr:hypothetical protein [Leptospiraceae bacterium]